MRPVKVVTDSTCDIPPDLLKTYDIYVAPMCIQFGTSTFQEGVDISRDYFWRRVDEGIIPKTSQPAAGVLARIYKRLADEGADIISVHITSVHSGTYQTALLAKGMVPGATIEVIDSRAISLGTGYQALAAARAAAEGKSLQDIVRIVEGIRARLSHLIALDTLKFLIAGGRVSSFQGALATLLSIKPILTVREGALTLHERPRTRQKSLDRIVQMLREAVGDRPIRAAVMHARAPVEGEAVLGRVRREFNCVELLSGELALSLTCHSGPGLVGIIAYTEPDGGPV